MKRRLAGFWAAVALVALLAGTLHGQEQKSGDTSTDTRKKTLEEMTIPEIQAMAMQKTAQAAYGVLIRGRYDDHATEAVAQEALGWHRAKIMRVLSSAGPEDYYRIKDQELSYLLNINQRVTIWSARRSNYKLLFCRFVIDNATHPDLKARARLRYQQEMSFFEQEKDRYQNRRR